MGSYTPFVKLQLNYILVILFCVNYLFIIIVLKLLTHVFYSIKIMELTNKTEIEMKFETVKYTTNKGELSLFPCHGILQKDARLDFGNYVLDIEAGSEYVITVVKVKK